MEVVQKDAVILHEGDASELVSSILYAGEYSASFLPRSGTFRSQSARLSARRLSLPFSSQANASPIDAEPESTVPPKVPRSPLLTR